MSDQPKRRFWQLHLSSIVVLTLLAGGLLFLNIQDRKDSYSNLVFYKYAFGWPDPAVMVISNENGPDIRNFLYKKLAWDGCVTILILVIGVVILEHSPLPPSDWTKRRWFHLARPSKLTLIGVICLVLILNLRHRPYGPNSSFGWVCGWPVVAMVNSETNFTEPNIYILNPVLEDNADFAPSGSIRIHSWPSVSGILMWIVPNAIVGLFVVVLPVAWCELLHRRRESRRQ